MRRDLALEALKAHVTDDIVVAVYQACFDWISINPRDLNYVATGAMGQGISHGLGLALVRPDRRVLVLDGDGSLLMNLGALVTVAGAGCRNLYHFVFENGVYEVNGNHPIPGNGRTDFAAIARGAGYAEAVRFDDIAEFRAQIGGFLANPGPAMAVLDTEAGAPHPRYYQQIHSAEARDRFRRAINATQPP